MKMAATAISEDISIEAIIGNVFADDKISRSSLYCIGLIISSAFCKNMINKLFPFFC